METCVSVPVCRITGLLRTGASLLESVLYAACNSSSYMYS